MLLGWGCSEVRKSSLSPTLHPELGATSQDPSAPPPRGRCRGWTPPQGWGRSEPHLFVIVPALSSFPKTATFLPATSNLVAAPQRPEGAPPTGSAGRRWPPRPQDAHRPRPVPRRHKTGPPRRQTRLQLESPAQGPSHCVPPQPASRAESSFGVQSYGPDSVSSSDLRTGQEPGTEHQRPAHSRCLLPSCPVPPRSCEHGPAVLA